MDAANLTKGIQQWTAGVASPLSLHMAILCLIAIGTSKVRLRNSGMRKALGLGLFIMVLTIGYLKTSTEDNLYRKLKISRSPTMLDIQQGLDRIEKIVDEDTVAEMEQKLTGKTSAYYLKGKHKTKEGHDLFGDQYPLLDFDQKLSVAKESKKYRIIADQMIVFYSTFMLLPASSEKKSRILLMLALLAGAIVQLCLFETMSELEDLQTPIKQLIFSVSKLSDFAIFNVGELIQFAVSGMMLGTLLVWKLAARDTTGFINDLSAISKLVDNKTFVNRASYLIIEYSSCVESIKQSKNAKKYVTLAMVISTLVIGGALSLDYLEAQQAKSSQAP